MTKAKLHKSILIVVGGVGASVVIGLVVMRDSGSVRSDSTGTSQVPSSFFLGGVSQSVKEKITHLRHIVDKDPRNSRAAFELAQLLQDSHDNREAAKFYARGLESDSLNNAARVDYALCLYEIGNMSDALEQSRIVLRNNPVHAEALFNVGAIFANSANRDSAEIYWSKLISNHPGHELADRAKDNLRLLRGNSTLL